MTDPKPPRAPAHDLSEGASAVDESASSSPDPAVEAAILSAVAARGAAKSICPTDAARTLSERAWRGYLGRVRLAAVRLALAGRITILRKGKPVDPSEFKGVYRLAPADYVVSDQD